MEVEKSEFFLKAVTSMTPMVGFGGLMTSIFEVRVFTSKRGLPPVISAPTAVLLILHVYCAMPIPGFMS